MLDVSESGVDSYPPGPLRTRNYFNFLRSPKRMILRIREGDVYRSVCGWPEIVAAISSFAER
jgi:hypothetical protein